MTLSGYHVRIGAIAVGVFALAFLSTASGRLRLPKSNSYQPSYTSKTGTQLVLIYVGSSHCAWANDPRLPQLIKQAEITLQSLARSRGWEFKAVGVAVDWKIDDGLSHLRKLGAFDEISAGDNWGNSLAAHYSGTEPGSTPEILLVARDVIAPNAASGELSHSIADERVLAREIGVGQLQRWSSNGYPVPGM